MVKKNLSIIIDSMEGGGAEKVVAILLDELKDIFNIKLVLLSNKIVYNIPKEIEVIILYGSLISKIFKYKRFCKINKIDISFSVQSKSNLISLSSKLIGNKAKMVVGEHASQNQHRKDEKIYFFTKKIFIMLFYRLADQIICVSKRIAIDLEKVFYIKKERITTIYNPYDILEIKKKSLENVNNVVFKDKITLISVGTLYNVKNYPLIIEAFYRLNLSNSQLLILGTGKDEQELKNLVKKYDIEDKVIFLGFQSNPFKYLSKADLFILGSNNEGLPNVMIEALACKCNIVATDCISGPREILSPNSDIESQIVDKIEIAQYGLLTPVRNINKMVEAMQYHISNNNSFDSIKLYKRAIFFDKKNSIQKYIKALNKEI